MPKRKLTEGQERAARARQGRDETRAVREYLDAINVTKRRGRPLDPERVQARLETIDEQLGDSLEPLERLLLIQQRIDLTHTLQELTQQNGVDIEALEERFVEVAANFAERKGVSYQAWREIGVPAAVLRRAGVS